MQIYQVFCFILLNEMKCYLPIEELQIATN